MIPLCSADTRKTLYFCFAFSCCFCYVHPGCITNSWFNQVQKTCYLVTVLVLFAQVLRYPSCFRRDSFLSRNEFILNPVDYPE